MWNDQFLRFSDASPCQENGTFSSLASRHVKIFRIPFLTRIKYENRTNVMYYPETRSKIDAYLSTELKSKYDLFDVRSLDSLQLSRARLFIDTVAYHATIGIGAPLNWGARFPSGIIDTTTIIYLPVGVERESAEHVQARFYVLLINSSGQVFYSTCLPYNAGEWSSDIESFKNDVNGKLPLLKKE